MKVIIVFSVDKDNVKVYNDIVNFRYYLMLFQDIGRDKMKPFNNFGIKSEDKNGKSSNLYGVNEENGTTAWYDKDGKLDCITDTPASWEQNSDD